MNCLWFLETYGGVNRPPIKSLCDLIMSGGAIDSLTIYWQLTGHMLTRDDIVAVKSLLDFVKV
jgi:hypothetical protein